MKQKSFFQRVKDTALKVMLRGTKFASDDKIELGPTAKWRGLIRPSTMRIEHSKIAKQNDKPAFQGNGEMERRRNRAWI